jgi:hypothetical protein
MSERVGNSFRVIVAGGIAVCALAMAGALVLLAGGSLFDGAIVGGLTFFAFRWFWGATQRKRSLLSRGYHVGSRVGTYWVYEELRENVVVSLELPLDYLGRGEYDIHVPSERDWSATMPDWARERRAEIVERLQTVFKRSQIHFDPDSAQSQPHDA